MLSKPSFVIAAVMLASAAIASAKQPPLRVVHVRYVVSEQSAERVEATVTNLVERSLVTLGRITSVNSSTSHGTVDVEIKFKGDATEQDLAEVTQRIGQLAIGGDVLVISRSVQLRPPSLHQ